MDLKVPGESRESEDDGSEQVVERGGDTLDIVLYLFAIPSILRITPSIACFVNDYHPFQ